jgi:ribosomal-protein-alanine N-acetyltransferase
MIKIDLIEKDRCETCNSILRALPRWFGIEEAIVNYTKAVENLPTFVAKIDGEVVGFLSLESHNPYTSEIHVMTVRELFHRMGIGKALVTAAENYSHSNGAEFLMVKTLAPSAINEPYDRTRAFYLSVGFRPLQEFKKIWDGNNTCLVMVKSLNSREKTAVLPKEIHPFSLTINESLYLSDILPSDKPAYLEHFKEKQIHDQTLAIPYPYTDADADWWINHSIENTRKLGRSVSWALRKADGQLIGGIGFHDFEPGKSHRAELGYWLAKPFWNQGIMSEAVKKVVEYGFREFGLLRITANVFHFNIGSARVLEKAGFQLEGVLRKHYEKDGKIFDGKLYAMVNGTPSIQIPTPAIR